MGKLTIKEFIGKKLVYHKQQRLINGVRVDGSSFRLKLPPLHMQIIELHKKYDVPITIQEAFELEKRVGTFITNAIQEKIDKQNKR